MKKVCLFSMRIAPQQEAVLEKLAIQSGRNKSNVLRALIDLAGNDPAIRQRLGILPSMIQNQKQEAH